MSLAEDFLVFLRENQIKSFRTQDAYEWYLARRQGKGYYSNMVTHLLRPLFHKGFIRRSSRGWWHVDDYVINTEPIDAADIEVIGEADNDSDNKVDDTNDEFFEYIKEKIRSYRKR